MTLSSDSNEMLDPDVTAEEEEVVLETADVDVFDKETVVDTAVLSLIEIPPIVDPDARVILLYYNIIYKYILFIIM